MLPEDPIEIIKETTFASSPLMINVEFMELLDRYGEEEVWVILGKLKDFFR